MHEKNLQSSHYSRIHIQLFRYTISIYFLQIKKLQIYPISLSFPILQVIRATIITRVPCTNAQRSSFSVYIYTVARFDLRLFLFKISSLLLNERRSRRWIITRWTSYSVSVGRRKFADFRFRRDRSIPIIKTRPPFTVLT